MVCELCWSTAKRSRRLALGRRWLQSESNSKLLANTIRLSPREMRLRTNHTIFLLKYGTCGSIGHVGQEVSQGPFRPFHSFRKHLTSCRRLSGDLGYDV